MKATELEEALNEVGERIGHAFVRSESRHRAMQYIKGLLGRAERKNGWQIAEAIGEERPYGVQQFLNRSPWEADTVRDALRQYIAEHLGDPDGVLVADETGFLKKGEHSVGVQRQYSGTAGRIENCQVGVFLAYVSSEGQAFLDRALYLPKEWATNESRRHEAGVPEQVSFATKPTLARQMVKRALEAGVPARWVSADSVYGSDKRLRVWLESLPWGYVLAVTSGETVYRGFMPWRVKHLIAHLPADRWVRLSAGEGSKGLRWYDWQWLELTAPLVEGWQRWLLVRRSLDDPTDIQALVCFAPTQTTLNDWVGVAGRRWAIEMCFEEAKGEVGLDHYEVRTWSAWYRHITLACFAHALLAVLRAHQPPADQQKGALYRIPTCLSV